MNEKGIVLISGGVMVGLALLSGKGDTYKRVWASVVFTTLLAVVADVAPQVTGPFALAIVVASVATNQGVIGGFLTGSTAKAKTGSGAPTGVAGPVGSPSSSSAPPGPQGPVGSPAQ